MLKFMQKGSTGNWIMLFALILIAIIFINQFFVKEEIGVPGSSLPVTKSLFGFTYAGGKPVTIAANTTQSTTTTSSTQVDPKKQ
jgi:hypothetical protein